MHRAAKTHVQLMGEEVGKMFEKVRADIKLRGLKEDVD